MSIYKIKPACKDYLWGGHRLTDEYGVEYEGDVCAEAWVLSCHKDGQSLITDDIKEGQTLSQLVKEKKTILGGNCERFEDFPILIKLIDAEKKLSIQVHPDNDYAMVHENQYGKTEMWYILEAKENAFLYQGFEKEIDKEEFEKRIKDNTLTEVLYKRYVKRGDVIFISPGTLHAIGEGILLAEIQQNSNVTYRIYDYGRIGADGKPRELHISKALDVTKLTRPEEYVPKDGHVAICDYFCVDRVVIEEGKGYKQEVGADSFVSILTIDGECAVSSRDKKIRVKKGESLFVEANTGVVSIEGKAELLLTTVPSET
ncbi:mannose-6-phosphate isomerase [Butyrivibrio sp. X503]|uniref:type I phosphomannose isomerase catalytic subunit n=1 Tax=Butyrivibrio sp. X503 TaxID=2364878 RepID=UPI000EA881F9|nr:type I phosphomannose isomerase catalytic subunit [Butyrivibrio sp. X503]RKM53985.1 mannose-6-phosphate isomerase [Butyrivibrio sp. X503]